MTLDPRALPQPAFRVVLPIDFNFEQHISLEEHSILRACLLTPEFVFEYILTRWTDLVAQLDIDPFVSDQLYEDIAHYIDGHTTYSESGESIHLTTFSENFEEFKLLILKLRNYLKPFVNVVSNIELDRTVCMISPKQFGTKSTILEFWPLESELNLSTDVPQVAI